ncbi:MAG: hypothetical protein LC749_17835 [Actinobacteria bacterium]|nr:hypothetical protein [Actinomycetota bacterium]
MFEVLPTSVILLAVTHVVTLGFLTVDLRRDRPMSHAAAALRPSRVTP